ncbi:hypothetical protein L1049_025469 [Liquidambar formosana]|uniref:Reverse transcriptase zinc-binding domain-containing protein n=1 Tax=Liquidambar formosana TaxID=63359 RepID=A0AAP0R8G5_LIQFO
MDLKKLMSDESKDRISALADELLVSILSLLPTKDALRILDISVSDPVDDLTQKLFCCCPLLKSLIIQVFPEKEAEKIFNILVPTLRRLRISLMLDCFQIYEYKIVVDAPILEYLTIYDEVLADYLMRNLSSLVKAWIYIATGCVDDRTTNHANRVYSLLNGFSTVQFLSFSWSFIGFHDGDFEDQSNLIPEQQDIKDEEYTYYRSTAYRTWASSTSGSGDPLGELLWKQTIPNKVKHFIWKLGKDILPTHCNLIRKKVFTDMVCPRCGKKGETTLHCFRDCRVVKEVWAFCSMEAVVEVSPAANILSWVLDVAHKMGSEGIRKGTGEIVDIASRLLTDYTNALQDVTSVGIGVIVRDSAGRVIATAVKNIDGEFPSNVVEALGVHFAVQFVRDLGLQSVMVEGDNLEIINAINSQEINLSALGLILEDVQASMIGHFGTITVRHTQR